MRRKTGTRLPVILKQKLRGTATFSSHPLQKMRALKNLTNLSTFGDTEILNSDISRTSLTGLAAVEKVSGGDWTTVRFPAPSTFRVVCSLRSTQVVVSERMLEKVKMCEIRSEIYGASDHCPIVLEIEDALEATDEATTEDTVEATEPSAA